MNHEAGAARGGAQQPKASYPVDAWLEGREHPDGEDPLAPIHKVGSLIDGIALKEIVAQAPENSTVNETNSMLADFGDTVTTAHTHTYTVAPGDTHVSTPGVAGDTCMSTPPRTPRASAGLSAQTAGIGRPPIVTSGQLQPASMQSTANYGYSTVGANMLASANTSANNSMHDAEEHATASWGHAQLSPARADLNLSPPPSIGFDANSTKVPCSSPVFLEMFTLIQCI